MRIFFPLLLSLLALTLHAQQTQPVNNLLLGYQEFPTTILSHAADGAGNQYYTGIFRGQLTANKKELVAGQGLEDFFWVKTNAAGDVVKHKVFGSPNSEMAYANSMAMGSGNRMLFGVFSLEPMRFDNITINPYPSTVGSGSAASLVCTDTAGKVLWARRTNLQNFKIYYANNVFHVLAGINFMEYPPIKVDDETVLDLKGQGSLVHLQFDESGKFLSAKSIGVRRLGQSLNLVSFHSFSDKSLLLQVSLLGDTLFYINNNPVPLPNAYSSYQVLIKTDTAYKDYKAKVLNPQGQTLSGAGGNTLPICVSPSDSVYAVTVTESHAPNLALDGWWFQPLYNFLCVFDKNLTLRRQEILNNSVVRTYAPTPYKRRLYFRQLLFQNGQLYFNGQFVGINEAPMNAVSKLPVSTYVFPNLTTTIDVNGASRSFMAKCSPGFSGAKMVWYGDHSLYETASVAPAFLHTASDTSIAFVQQNDNTWNPWVIDSSLTVRSGSMKVNADMPEMPRLIRYFADGSRLVLGVARGRTAMDSPGSNIVGHSRRSDAFLVRIRPDNKVAWYKRFYSTLTAADIRGLEIKNGAAFFLINYLGSQNDSNFVKVDTEVYSVGVNACLLATVDTAGNLSVLNLVNPLLRNTALQQFSFFSNGDLAVVTNYTNMPLAGFTNTATGTHLFRLHPGNGTIIDSRKITGVPPGVVIGLQVDKTDQLHLLATGMVNSTPFAFQLHSKTAVLDNIQMASMANSQQVSLLKMDWNRFRWQKISSGNGILPQQSQQSLQLVGNKPVIFFGAASNNQPAYWDGKLIHNGTTTTSLSLAELDSNGVLQRQKLINGFTARTVKAAGNKFYLSGMMVKAIQVDTIQLSFGGGGVDGLHLVLDSNYVAKQSFRVASPYNETGLDMDLYKDSIAALAYTAQGSPQVYLNRVMTGTSDYEEDAYIGTVSARASITTGISTPLPPATHVSITPNPVSDQQLRLTVQVTEPLRSNVTVYSSSGQTVTGAVLSFSPGTKQYTITLPEATGKGVYHVVISNKRWTTTRTFMVL